MNFKKLNQESWISTKQNNKIEFTRIKSDMNGNPRYVCHFLNFVPDMENNPNEVYPFYDMYEVAVNRANTIGGRKYHNKSYGGGIVFQSYNIKDTERSILELVAKYNHPAPELDSVSIIASGYDWVCLRPQFLRPHSD